MEVVYRGEEGLCQCVDLLWKSQVQQQQFPTGTKAEFGNMIQKEACNFALSSDHKTDIHYC